MTQQLTMYKKVYLLNLFSKQFSLPNEAVVDEATMEDGMLKIQFGIKEIEKKSQKVNIK
jgi:HSP20 family molecular chaperone IbpA